MTILIEIKEEDLERISIVKKKLRLPSISDTISIILLKIRQENLMSGLKI